MPAGHKGYISRGDLEIIRNLCLTKSDQQIADQLGRDVRTIARARKKLGISKGYGGQIKALIPKEKTSSVDPTVPVINPTQHLNEKQRKEFFKTQLVNSLYYHTLQEQFTDDEIKYYLEEWGALSVQFDDIANSEKRQIDEFIKAEIMGNRILRNIKIAEQEIELLAKEIDELRKTKDMESDEQAQERDNMLMSLIRSLHSQTQAMSNDYDRNVNLKNRLLSELNARRRDRIDQIKKGGTTFISLVEAFRDKQLRAVQGRHIELVRIAKEKKKNDWHKPVTYPDGTKDCVLMDENAEILEQNIVLYEPTESQFVKKYAELKDKNILVIDDDIRRQNFFGQKFNGNKISFASNVDKAKLLIGEDKPYDLICLDYDLGLNQKGDKLVDFILNNNLYKQTEFLVHSMNKEGAEKIKVMLATERTVEQFPFEDIVKQHKEQTNA